MMAKKQIAPASGLIHGTIDPVYVFCSFDAQGFFSSLLLVCQLALPNLCAVICPLARDDSQFPRWYVHILLTNITGRMFPS
jgi:hypothetical protein